MTVGDKIKKIREEKKMTQEELAKHINSTKQTIYKYENNIVTNIPSDKVEGIAKALGTSPSYLMGWEKIEEDLDFSTNLTSIYFNSLMKWTEDKLFRKHETTVIRGHMAELFLRYKKITEQLVYAQREWDNSKESFSKFYKEKPNPLTDREIKEIFLRQQLETSLNDLSSWVQSLPSWTTREELKYVEENETASTLVKEKSKIIGIPNHEEIPEYLKPVAAHLDGEVTEEVQDFIDKF